MPQLRTLGSVAVVDQTANGEHHFDVQQKRLALLVFLARGGRGQFVRRDALVAHFWPDSDEQHARGVLRQALTAFRKELGGDVLVTHGEDEVGVSPDALTCDATAFEAACRAREYEAACTLYRGHFLEGFHASGASPDFEQWVDIERDRLRRLASDASWRMASQLEAEGRTAEAVDSARRAVELDPDDEPGVARLIALLDQHGDRSGALTVYAALVRRLAEGFSAQPAPETRALMKALRQRPTPVYTPPPVPPVVQVVEQAPTSVAEVRSRPRRRFFIAGAAGALAVVALAVLLGPTRPALRSSAALRATVAVVPFRVHSADADLAWLRDGMVELLTMRLSGTGGITVIEPGRVLAAWRSVTGDSLVDEPTAALAKFAGQVGAGRIVCGSVTGSADHLALAAWIVDVTDGHTEAQATVEGPADSLAFLVDRLSARLLGLVAGVGNHRLISLEAAPLPAIRAFLVVREAVASPLPGDPTGPGAGGTG